MVDAVTPALSSRRPSAGQVMSDAIAPTSNSRGPSAIVIDTGSASPTRRPSGGNTDVSHALRALQIPPRSNNGQSRGTLSSSTREGSLARSNSPNGSQNRLALYLDRYTVTKVLGEGSYGKVKLAIDSHTGEKVALKVFQKATVKKLVHITRIKREVYVMRLLHHPNITKLYDVVETEKEIVLSMEYVNGGELFDYIVAQRRVKEKTARRFFRQIVSALDYCHKSSIIHRDLKPENLLLDQERNIRIIDFGFVNLFDHDDVMKTFCGSPYYASPEMIGSKNYVGPEVDIWSLGVILFALLAGHLPFRDQNTVELYRKIATGTYECPDYFSKESRDLIARMLDVDPLRRASIEEIKMHPWTLDGHDGPPENLVPTRPKLLPGDETKLNPDTLATMVQYGFEENALAKRIVEAQGTGPAFSVYCLIEERNNRLLKAEEVLRSAPSLNQDRNKAESARIAAAELLGVQPTETQLMRALSRKGSDVPPGSPLTPRTGRELLQVEKLSEGSKSGDPSANIGSRAEGQMANGAPHGGGIGVGEYILETVDLDLVPPQYQGSKRNIEPSKLTVEEQRHTKPIAGTNVNSNGNVHHDKEQKKESNWRNGNENEEIPGRDIVEETVKARTPSPIVTSIESDPSAPIQPSAPRHVSLVRKKSKRREGDVHSPAATLQENMASDQHPEWQPPQTNDSPAINFTSPQQPDMSRQRQTSVESRRISTAPENTRKDELKPSPMAHLSPEKQETSSSREPSVLAPTALHAQQPAMANAQGSVRPKRSSHSSYREPIVSEDPTRPTNHGRKPGGARSRQSSVSDNENSGTSKSRQCSTVDHSYHVAPPQRSRQSSIAEQSNISQQRSRQSSKSEWQAPPSTLLNAYHHSPKQKSATLPHAARGRSSSSPASVQGSEDIPRRRATLHVPGSSGVRHEQSRSMNKLSVSDGRNPSTAPDMILSRSGSSRFPCLSPNRTRSIILAQNETWNQNLTEPQSNTSTSTKSSIDSKVAGENRSDHSPNQSGIQRRNSNPRSPDGKSSKSTITEVFKNTLKKFSSRTRSPSGGTSVSPPAAESQPHHTYLKLVHEGPKHHDDVPIRDVSTTSLLHVLPGPSMALPTPVTVALSQVDSSPPNQTRGPRKPRPLSYHSGFDTQQQHQQMPWLVPAFEPIAGSDARIGPPTASTASSTGTLPQNAGPRNGLPEPKFSVPSSLAVFSAETTSTLPADRIVCEIDRVLRHNKIHVRWDGYRVYCAADGVEFEIEITKVKDTDMCGVEFRRAKGSTWAFQSVCRSLMTQWKL